VDVKEEMVVVESDVIMPMIVIVQREKLVLVLDIIAALLMDVGG
jgi:hypothetical protein